ncbi:MAG: HAMP domain-containing sensor histidine kinase [Chloroflexota bacterium]
MDRDGDAPTRAGSDPAGAGGVTDRDTSARRPVPEPAGEARPGTPNSADLPTALADELFSTLAHELRAPITTIKGASRTLLRHIAVLDPAASRQLLQDIDQEADRLHRLVDNLLELARAGAGPSALRTELTSVDALIRRVVADATPRAGDRRLRVRLPARMPQAPLDPVRVEQVIRNLVDNAVKYSSPGGAVDVGAIVRDDAIVVTVKDDGPGIAQEHHAKIFERFFRVQRGGVSGAGLGLTVCKRFVELHGGQIEVESEPGHGAEFRFSLPLAESGSVKDAVPC